MAFEKKKNILLLLAITFVALMFFGCTNNRDSEDASVVSSDSIYIKLTMNTPLVTRSIPNGGEAGDGSEVGVNHENKIHKLALFFYRTNDAKGIESAEQTVSLIRIDVDQSKIVQTGNSPAAAMIAIPVSTLLLNVPYHVVVVANAEDADLNRIVTLADLQTNVMKTVYSTGAQIGDYDNFVMVSRFKTMNEDEQYTLTAANKIDMPLGITSTLERLAARIDVVPLTSVNGAVYNATDGYYSYPVGTDGDFFKLQGLKAINCMRAGTYLLKHIADANPDGTIADSYHFIGSEEEISGKETNYVLDPWTRGKTIAASMLDLDGVNTPISNFYFNYFNLSGTTDTWNSWDGVPSCNVDVPYILSYTLENTMAQAEQTNKYSTGLLLKGIYVPHAWYILKNGSLTKQPATAGATFYVYDNGIYGSTEALLMAVNEKMGSDYTDVSQVLGFSCVRTYTAGVCYYNYWIRHSNNGDKERGIMEFAVVRNNIYRVTINSFAAIGSSVPNTNPVPDEYMNITIHVIPWSLYQHSPIYM